MDKKERVNIIIHSAHSIRNILAGVGFTAKDFIDTQLFDDDITKQHILDDLLLAQTELVELINFVSKMEV